jgi:hypothetical protein
MSFGEMIQIYVVLCLCTRVSLGLAVSSCLSRYMFRPCCPLIPSPRVVLFVFVEDCFSLLFSANARSKWIIIQQLTAPFSLLGDFNPMSMMGSIPDHLDVRVTTHLRVVSGISSAPDRGLCSPARLIVRVEWPALPDLLRSDH